MANLLSKLKNKSLLSESELIIAQYLMENYRDFQNLSTRELAKRTFTSSAAIIRFCQKLGFKGYTDFKISFLTEIMQHGEEVQAQIINDQENIHTIMNKVRAINISAINYAYDRLNPAILARTMKLFNNADYIDFYTVDSCTDFANRVASSFYLINKYSTVHYSMPLQYLQAYKTPKNHLGFFIHPSGENRLLIDIAKLLKRQAVPTILITASPSSALAGLVNETFIATIGDDLSELGFLTFLSSAKFISDTLFAVMLTQDKYKYSLEKDVWIFKNLQY